MEATIISDGVAEGTNWRLDAACVEPGIDPDFFFDLAEEDRSIEAAAKRICGSCPVQQMCLDAALAQEEEFGIFGGMNPKERQRHRKTWKRELGQGGTKIVRAQHGIVRQDPGVERKYLARNSQARRVLEMVKASDDFYRKNEYVQVLDMIIHNPATNMTVLGERLGKSRPWFEGMFRNICKQFGQEEQGVA
jgi:hypothetical protein